MPNIERLQQLRRVVEAAPEDRLHMRTYAEHAECGTCRCAIGWCKVDPWFQENTEIDLIFRETPDGLVDFIGGGPVSARLGTLFGISRGSAINLFAIGQTGRIGGRVLGPHDITKAEVLANIDRVTEGNEATRYPAAFADIYGF